MDGIEEARGEAELRAVKPYRRGRWRWCCEVRAHDVGREKGGAALQAHRRGSGPEQVGPWTTTNGVAMVAVLQTRVATQQQRSREGSAVGHLRAHTRERGDELAMGG